MPELMGELQPETVANLVLDYLDSPEKLDQMRDRLLAVRGKSGASERIAAIVEEQLKSSTSVSKTISTTTTPDRS
jgi:lipid-A-disaccharide synthase